MTPDEREEARKICDDAKRGLAGFGPHRTDLLSAALDQIDADEVLMLQALAAMVWTQRMWGVWPPEGAETMDALRTRLGEEQKTLTPPVPARCLRCDRMGSVPDGGGDIVDQWCNNCGFETSWRKEQGADDERE